MRFRNRRLLWAFCENVGVEYGKFKHCRSASIKKTCIGIMLMLEGVTSCTCCSVKSETCVTHAARFVASLIVRALWIVPTLSGIFDRDVTNAVVQKTWNQTNNESHGIDASKFSTVLDQNELHYVRLFFLAQARLWLRQSKTKTMTNMTSLRRRKTLPNPDP